MTHRNLDIMRGMKIATPVILAGLVSIVIVWFLFGDLFEHSRMINCLERTTGDIAECAGDLPLYETGSQDYENMALPQ